MKKYHEEVLLLLTKEGFHKKYKQSLRSFESTQDAYEGVEHVVVHWFGVCVYSNFESFKTSTNNYLSS
jgi:hypothetical protein